MLIVALALILVVILSASAVVVIWGMGEDWTSLAPEAATTDDGNPAAHGEQPWGRLEEEDPALALLLLSALMEAGSSLAGALQSLGRSLPGRDGRQLRQAASGLLIGAPWEECWPAEGSGQTARLIQDALGPAVLTGAPSVESLSSMASSYRSAWRSTARIQAQKAGVELLLPLTLCHLPSFLLLGIGIFGLALMGSLWGGGE